MFMNINGRVCFISLLSFGFLGIVIGKYVTPFFNTLFYNSVVFNSFVVGIFDLFLIDFIYSCLSGKDMLMEDQICFDDQFKLVNINEIFIKGYEGV